MYFAGYQSLKSDHTPAKLLIFDSIQPEMSRVITLLDVLDSTNELSLKEVTCMNGFVPGRILGRQLILRSSPSLQFLVAVTSSRVHASHNDQFRPIE